jgi:hypothetical protein
VARRYAYQADPKAYVERGKTERKHRRVSLRPAPDTMSWLSGYLPVEQGVACLAALRRQADALRAQGGPRSRDQIMADTLVERLTGQATAANVNVEVQLLMPLACLLDPTNCSPATIPGHGVIPAELAREIIRHSKGRHWWRRLFTAPSSDTNPAGDPHSQPGSGVDSQAAGDGHPRPGDAASRQPANGGDPSPVSGPIVAGDPFRRRFDGWLAELIKLRDQTCRDPYCDAPIRHLDHIRRHTDGGPTTLANGRGVCERGNYAREMPGWKITVLDDGLHGNPHTIMITTPTGHSYTSTAPQPP